MTIDVNIYDDDSLTGHGGGWIEASNLEEIVEQYKRILEDARNEFDYFSTEVSFESGTPEERAIFEDWKENHRY
jgi:hypothetical protein